MCVPIWSMGDKRAFRKKKRWEIRCLPESYIADSDAGITRRLVRLPEFCAAKRLFAYCSVGREVDTRQILTLAAQASKAIALPVVLGEGRMEFALFQDFEKLRAGALQIPEPGPEAPRLQPEAGDLILVPGLCFDAEGYRLGQGGGYYDRLLECCPALSVGLARERLMCPDIPREAHDRPVDILITEARTLR